MTTIGSLFSGYGGLDMGVQLALGTMRTAWVSDIEPGPKAILKARFPNAPNLGDITTIDWNRVEPVDIICGGSPCQDLSNAGQRRGMKPGTRSGLWESMAHAIETIQPRLVVWENVLGALSADAYSLSDLEPGAGPLGNRSDGSLLRALGRVLGDLTNLGYDAAWTTVRASDIGAPHNRARVFVVAYPHESGSEEWGQSLSGPQEEPAAVISDNLLPTPQARDGKGIPGDGYNVASLPRAVSLLPTPCAQPSGNSPDEHLRKKPGRTMVTDLAILVENDLLKTGGRLFSTPDTAPEAPNTGSNSFKAGNVVGLGNQVKSLLPTPKAGDADFGLPRTSGRPPEKSTHLATRLAYTDWGDYAHAVSRWEQVLGRPAPAPTLPTGRDGKHQLSAPFVEWMMGLPEGWITDVDISRARQLRALGNGVVPQQGAHAITEMLAWQEAVA